MITPRATRLVRVGGLQAFREAAISLAMQGAPLDSRNRLVIVPTRAAAEQLVRGIEDADDFLNVLLAVSVMRSRPLEQHAPRLFSGGQRAGPIG